ncbi:MAG: DUF3244 domain-containing protein [Bacteroidales bacterium]|nr:DUF3244 domain-containing protein [Bacteroidales bacterium]
MKKVFILLFVLAALGASSIQAAGNSLSITAEQILIKETNKVSGPLRSAPAPVVSAWLVDSQISLTFLQDLGTVTITVTGTQGEVYQTSVSVTDGTELTIDTQGWPAGDYVIEIVRSTGKTYTGDFEL